MIEILVVDDESQKRSSIAGVLLEMESSLPIRVTEAATAFDAISAMKSRRFDLLVLDIVLPVRDGESASRAGGMAVLQECRPESGSVTRRTRRPNFVIGLTQFEDIRSEVGADFADAFSVVLQWSPSSTEWADAMRNYVAIAARALGEGAVEYDSDVLILTALQSPELDAVKRFVPSWEAIEYRDDPTLYLEAQVEGVEGSVRVIACSAVEPGMAHSAALCSKAVQRFRPRLVLMSGIAAGFVGALGDVLVADLLWDYGSGKLLESEPGQVRFLPNPRPIPVPPVVRNRIVELLSDGKLLATVQSEWQGESQKTQLGFQVGPIACGAAVVEATSVVDDITYGQRKAIGLEMEGYGIAVAVSQAAAPRPLFGLIKSVCDFGVHPKRDAAQAYAAYTSAAVTLALVRALRFSRLV